MKHAIRSRNLNNVKWIHQCNEGFEWKSDHFDVAIEYGELEIMKWMKASGCPWDSYTFQFAAITCDGNNFEILEWLRINNCPWDHETFYKSDIEQPAVHEWLLSHSMTLNFN